MMARAQATRCCWPPDSWLGRCVSRFSRPTTLTTWLNQSRSIGRFAICNGSRMFSSADSVGTRLNDWKMNPICSRRRSVNCFWFMEETSRPSTITLPDEGASSPAMQCMSVDLPEPEGPMMAVISPRLNSTFT